MDDLFDLLNWAYQRTKDVKDEHTTYEQDTEADHEDGQYIGKKAAYSEIVRKCAELIAGRAERL